ncbi:MAG: ATP-binding protein [Rhizobiaceae bacterium]
MAAIPAIMKTTAARLSALYLILFTLCAVALVFYMTSLSLRIFTSQTQASVAEEVEDLARIYRRGGLPALVRLVDRRSRQPGAYLYLIADPNGRILAGNVEELEPGVLENDGWTQRPFWYDRFGETGGIERNHHAIAQIIRLPNQMILLVGRDLGEPERFRQVVRRALMFALGVMAIGGFLIWFFVGRRALKRIDGVTDASRRIMAGDLSGRLPVSGAGDEFDRLSQNLNAMLERIASLNEGLKQVSDNIAHDLKTPLTRLRNRAEDALSGRKKTAEYRDALEGTIAEADQLIRTFNAILMISRLEAGYSAEPTAEVDLDAILADVVELYEPVAEDASVKLTVESPGRTTVKGNRELIGQALSNILDNAIKYSAGNGEGPMATLKLERRGDEVLLSVADNGPGIAEADRERATERFVRLEESRSQPGSGIGLALAKAVMHFHGGRLELAGADNGLTVTMAFPTGAGDA